MHLRFAETSEVMESRVREIAEREQIWTFAQPFISEGTHLQRYEYQVGRASMKFSVDEMVALFRELAGEKKSRR